MWLARRRLRWMQPAPRPAAPDELGDIAQIRTANDFCI